MRREKLAANTRSWQASYTRRITRRRFIGAVEVHQTYDPVGRILGRYIPPPSLPRDWSIVHGQLNKNRGAYRLTDEGRRIARRLLRDWLKVKPHITTYI
jgi:hypothetical protein